MQILLLEQLASVLTVSSQWGKRIQFLYWLKPWYNHINTAPLHPSFKTTSSRQNHKQTPVEILCVSIFSSQPPYCTYTYIWNKYPKRGTLATKYILYSWIAHLNSHHICLLDKVERGILNAASSAQWPNNEVPYVLEAVFTSADRAIIAAVSIWSSDQKHTAKRKCQQFEANIPRKGISGPQSQFPHSCVCERIIYFHDGAAVSAGGNMWTGPGNI